MEIALDYAQQHVMAIVRDLVMTVVLVLAEADVDKDAQVAVRGIANKCVLHSARTDAKLVAKEHAHSNAKALA